MIKIWDGLQNLISNLGTSRDKGSGAEYTGDLIQRTQIYNAYQDSKLVQRSIDLPAEDACREWREWSASAQEISKIEAEEKRLGVRQKCYQASRLARLYGGAALMMVTREQDLSQPLDTDAIGKGGLKYLTVLTDLDLSAGETERDPRKPYFRRPSMWNLAGADLGVPDIHPSRLVIFNGTEPLAEESAAATGGFGNSQLQSMLTRLRAVDEVAANVLSLIYEAKIDVLKIPDLMENLETHGEEFEKVLLKRATLGAAGKGINGQLLLDANESYEQKSASFGTLDAIIDRMMQLASMAAEVPMTILFGQSPAGMNATGESDIRAYYDRVRVHQTLRMEPEMSLLDEGIIRSSLGGRPESIFYDWRSLWQPTAKERADTGKILTETMEKADRMGAVSGEAAAVSLVNALVENGVFPGLEKAAKDYPVDNDSDIPPSEGGEDPDPDGNFNANDAAPQPLYVRRDVLNAEAIIDWAKSQGFKTTLPDDDLHVTIAFSRKPVDWFKMGEAWQSELKIPEGGPRQMEKFGDATVLLFGSSELIYRHDRMIDDGATWDHAEYQPHITISYAKDGPAIEDIEPYQGEIILGPEIFQEIKEDWQEGIEEK